MFSCFLSGVVCFGHVSWLSCSKNCKLGRYFTRIKSVKSVGCFTLTDLFFWYPKLQLYKMGHKMWPWKLLTSAAFLFELFNCGPVFMHFIRQSIMINFFWNMSIWIKDNGYGNFLLIWIYFGIWPKINNTGNCHMTKQQHWLALCICYCYSSNAYTVYEPITLIYPQETEKFPYHYMTSSPYKVMVFNNN